MNRQHIKESSKAGMSGEESIPDHNEIETSTFSISTRKDTRKHLNLLPIQTNDRPESTSRKMKSSVITGLAFALCTKLVAAGFQFNLYSDTNCQNYFDSFTGSNDGTDGTLKEYSDGQVSISKIEHAGANASH